MALDKTGLKTAIKNLLNDMKSREENQDQAIDDFTDALGDAIDDYVKTATIQATPAQISSAGMVADPTTGVVTAANNLSSGIS